MCGIFGVISKRQFGFNYKEITIFEELMYVGAVRGEDATGVITVEKTGDFHIDKAGITASEFRHEYDKAASKAIALQTGMALIGHNRKGTVGHISDETAHPFVINDCFAMVHNGTLTGHKLLADTTVDSEALAIVLERGLNSDKPEQFVEELSAVNGAYAVVGYNQKTHKVHMIRNSQRPLVMAETEDAFFFASEGSMLSWILSRNNVTAKAIAVVPEETLFTFSFEKGGATLAVEKLTLKKPIPVTPATWGRVTGMVRVSTTTIDLSKRAFKKMRGQNIGKVLEFYITDCVEKYLFSQEAATEYCIMGESEVFSQYPHLIHGELDLTLAGMADISYVDCILFQGIIDDMDYDKETKTTKFFVSKVTKVSKTYTNPLEITYDKNSIMY